MPRCPCIVICGLVVAACGDPPDTGTIAAASPVRLELVRHVGMLDGPLAFGAVAGLAVGRNGLLAVADVQSCQISIFSTTSMELQGRVGGCGGGPGELRQLMRIAWHGDSVVAYDARAREMVVLDLAGMEVRRVRLGELFNYGVVLPWPVSVPDDTTWAMSLALVPATLMNERWPDRRHLLLAYLDSRDGTVRTAFHEDSEFSRRNRANFGRGIWACGSPRNPELFAGLSIWGLEGWFYRFPDTIPYATFVTDVPDLDPREVSPGEWYPAPGTQRITCSDDWVAFWVLRASVDEPRRFTGGVVEFRAWDGTLISAKALTDADSALFGMSVAGANQVFVANTFDWPVVSQFRVVREP